MQYDVHTICCPFYVYLPKQKNILFKNANIWTNEDAGFLQNADLIICNGKIIAIGTPDQIAENSIVKENYLGTSFEL